MDIDINKIEVNERIFEKLKDTFGDLRELPSEKTSVSKRYGPGEKAKVPFESMTVTTMHNVEIRNVDDREKLDLCNSFVVLLMPANHLPLPVFASDVDVHKGIYVHLIADLIPLSKNSEYLKKYDAPVKKLREKHKDLPGLMVKVPEKMYQIFPAIKQFFSILGPFYPPLIARDNACISCHCRRGRVRCVRELCPSSRAAIFRDLPPRRPPGAPGYSLPAAGPERVRTPSPPPGDARWSSVQGSGFRKVSPSREYGSEKCSSMTFR